MKTIKICPQCKGEFSPKYAKQRFCSRHCVAQSKKKPPVYNMCEICNQRFETNRFDLARGYGRFCSRECKSLAQEKRVTIACEHCGDLFQVRPCEDEQRFCSQICSVHARKQYVVCKNCGDEFWSKGVSRVFCSNKCQGLFERNYIEKVCEGCGKTYEGPAHRNVRFCSARCAKKRVMDHAGISTRYDGFTKSLKEQIRKRDRRRCQLCGKKRVFRKLDVHHINYVKHDNRPINLVSLCHSCHPKTNYDRQYWKRYFQKFMKERYPDY